MEMRDRGRVLTDVRKNTYTTKSRGEKGRIEKELR